MEEKDKPQRGKPVSPPETANLPKLPTQIQIGTPTSQNLPTTVQSDQPTSSDRPESSIPPPSSEQSAAGNVSTSEPARQSTREPSQSTQRMSIPTIQHDPTVAAATLAASPVPHKAPLLRALSSEISSSDAESSYSYEADAEATPSDESKALFAAPGPVSTDSHSVPSHPSSLDASESSTESDLSKISSASVSEDAKVHLSDHSAIGHFGTPALQPTTESTSEPLQSSLAPSLLTTLQSESVSSLQPSSPSKRPGIQLADSSESKKMKVLTAKPPLPPKAQQISKAPAQSCEGATASVQLKTNITESISEPFLSSLTQSLLTTLQSESVSSHEPSSPSKRPGVQLADTSESKKIKVLTAKPPLSPGAKQISKSPTRSCESATASVQWKTKFDSSINHPALSYKRLTSETSTESGIITPDNVSISTDVSEMKTMSTDVQSSVSNLATSPSVSTPFKLPETGQIKKSQPVQQPSQHIQSDSSTSEFSEHQDKTTSPSTCDTGSRTTRSNQSTDISGSSFDYTSDENQGAITRESHPSQHIEPAIAIQETEHENLQAIESSEQSLTSESERLPESVSLPISTESETYSRSGLGNTSDDVPEISGAGGVTSYYPGTLTCESMDTTPIHDPATGKRTYPFEALTVTIQPASLKRVAEFFDNQKPQTDKQLLKDKLQPLHSLGCIEEKKEGKPDELNEILDILLGRKAISLPDFGLMDNIPEPVGGLTIEILYNPKKEIEFYDLENPLSDTQLPRDKVRDFRPLGHSELKHEARSDFGLMDTTPSNDSATGDIPEPVGGLTLDILYKEPREEIEFYDLERPLSDTQLPRDKVRDFHPLGYPEHEQEAINPSGPREITLIFHTPDGRNAVSLTDNAIPVEINPQFLKADLSREQLAVYEGLTTSTILARLASRAAYVPTQPSDRTPSTSYLGSDLDISYLSKGSQIGPISTSLPNIIVTGPDILPADHQATERVTHSANIIWTIPKDSASQSAEEPTQAASEKDTEPQKRRRLLGCQQAFDTSDDQLDSSLDGLPTGEQSIPASRSSSLPSLANEPQEIRPSLERSQSLPSKKENTTADDDMHTESQTSDESDSLPRSIEYQRLTDRLSSSSFSLDSPTSSNPPAQEPNILEPNQDERSAQTPQLSTRSVRPALELDVPEQSQTSPLLPQSKEDDEESTDESN